MGRTLIRFYPCVHRRMLEAACQHIAANRVDVRVATGISEYVHLTTPPSKKLVAIRVNTTYPLDSEFRVIYFRPSEPEFLYMGRGPQKHIYVTENVPAETLNLSIGNYGNLFWILDSTQMKLSPEFKRNLKWLRRNCILGGF